jgi:hypothetical protein
MRLCQPQQRPAAQSIMHRVIGPVSVRDSIAQEHEKFIVVLLNKLHDRKTAICSSNLCIVIEVYPFCGAASTLVKSSEV